MFNNKYVNFSISAINKRTNKLELPIFANKYDINNIKNEFLCCDCNQGLNLAKGGKRRHYFAHICLDKCQTHTLSDKLNESVIHLEAKRQLKIILESSIQVSIQRKCPYKSTCIHTTIIPKLETTDEIVLEYSFIYKGQKYADVALINKNILQMKYCFEIKMTSKTEEWKRPEPWFEFDALSVLNTIAKLEKDSTSIIFDDIRCVNCDKCQKQYLFSLFSKELKQTFIEKENEVRRKENEVRRKKLMGVNEIIRKKQLEEIEIRCKKQALMINYIPFIPPHSRPINTKIKFIPKVVEQDNDKEILKNYEIQKQEYVNKELDELERRYALYDKHKTIFEEQDFNRLLYLRINNRHQQLDQRLIDIEVLKSRSYLNIITKSGIKKTIHSPYYK